MICSSNEIIQKAQALRQSFRSVGTRNRIRMHPSIILPMKAYFFDCVNLRPVNNSKIRLDYKIQSYSPKEKFSKSLKKSNYLREKVFFTPILKKSYVNYLNSSIREENTVMNLNESQKITKNKIKLSLHLPMCRPNTREAALSKSSKNFNIFI